MPVRIAIAGELRTTTGFVEISNQTSVVMHFIVKFSKLKSALPAASGETNKRAFEGGLLLVKPPLLAVPPIQ